MTDNDSSPGGTTALRWEPATPDTSGPGIDPAVIRSSPAPALLISLTDMAVVTASPAALALLGLSRRPQASVYFGQLVDVEGPRTLLAHLRDGLLDSYRGRRLVEIRGQLRELRISVGLPAGDRSRRHAVAIFSEKPVDLGDDIINPQLPAQRAPQWTIGLVDRAGAVRTISATGDQFLDAALTVASGFFWEMTHPQDAPLVLATLAQAGRRCRDVPARIRFGNPEHGWAPYDVVVAPLTDQSLPAFTFAAGPEGTLAAGAAPAPDPAAPPVPLRPRGASVLPGTTHPVLDRLSAREREIVLLLLRGERVPAIARQLFVSHSTVRNHLTTVFRKTGVHSQQELLDLLRRPPA